MSTSCLHTTSLILFFHCDSSLLLALQDRQLSIQGLPLSLLHDSSESEDAVMEGAWLESSVGEQSFGPGELPPMEAAASLMNAFTASRLEAEAPSGPPGRRYSADGGSWRRGEWDHPYPSLSRTSARREDGDDAHSLSGAQSIDVTQRMLADRRQLLEARRSARSRETDDLSGWSRERSSDGWSRGASVSFSDSPDTRASTLAQLSAEVRASRSRGPRMGSGWGDEEGSRSSSAVSTSPSGMRSCLPTPPIRFLNGASLGAGDGLDVKDVVKKWCPAVVVSTRSASVSNWSEEEKEAMKGMEAYRWEVYVHYVGWDKRFDEWVPVTPLRVAKLGTHTRYSGSARRSPFEASASTPNTPLALSQGSRVGCVFMMAGRRRVYNGTIVNVRDRTYDIRFDDGDFRSGVSGVSDLIRSIHAEC